MRSSFSKTCLKTLQWGTLPKCYLSESVKFKIAYLQSYTDTYLEEEIQKESEIRKLGAFSRFLELAANENSKLVNYARIGRAANLHPTTIKEYFSILSDTLIANHVPAWSAKIRVQLQQSSKFYFFDCGVLNALTGNLHSEIKEGSYRYGMLFENFVVNEIIRRIHRERLEINVYHYRDENQQEIDLILQRNPLSKPVAVEVKSSPTPEISARHVIHRFDEVVPNSRSLVISGADKAYAQKGLDIYPIQQGIEKALEAALE
jgi:predicted AAA+ superfamily ATPase